MQSSGGQLSPQGNSIVPDNLQQDFEQRFGKQTMSVRAPARVNLIGEHTDYNAGLTLPLASRLYTYCVSARRKDDQIHVYSANVNETVQINTQAQVISATSHWGDYVCAIVAEIQKLGPKLPGMNIALSGEIPLGGGLSSSASMLAALAHTMLSQNGTPQSGLQLAKLCHRAESEQLGMQCGLLDQYAVCCATDNEAMMLDCNTEQHQPVKLPDTLRWFVFDSGIAHQLRDGAYNQRRQECATALQTMQSAGINANSLAELSTSQLESCGEVLEPTLLKRARHVASENDRVTHMFNALKTDSCIVIGKLLNQSHSSLRDDYEVSCADVDRLVTAANSVTGVLGARMIGGGFGGCILCAIDNQGFDQTVEKLLHSVAAIIGRRPWHHHVSPCGHVETIE